MKKLVCYSICNKVLLFPSMDEWNGP